MKFNELANLSLDDSDQEMTTSFRKIGSPQTLELPDITGIGEELFDVAELPKDKTRVIWIVNSAKFIDKI